MITSVDGPTAAAQSGRSPWSSDQVSLARVSVRIPVCSARTAAAAAEGGQAVHLTAVLGPGEGEGAHGGGFPGAGGGDRELQPRRRGAHLPNQGGLPHIQGGAVRGHFQQGKIDDGAVEDRSVADAGDGEEALLRVQDALGGVEVGAGDAVNRRPVDPPQRARFFDAVGGGDSSAAAIEHLINQ
jgi:hypothetical protein